MRKVACYRPGPRFPAISITGPGCELGCPHCAGRPLSAMIPAETPERLTEVARRLEADGALGFLLSGGCSRDCVLRLDRHLGAIRQIKGSTGLRINAHVGFPRRGDALALVASGIDSFSITYPISDDVGRRYLLLDDALTRYEETFEGLVAAGAKSVVPHALLGLGEPREDMKGVRALAADPPAALVVIAFVPLRGAPMEGRRPTDETHIVESLELMRELMPRTKLVLGCMRPRGRPDMERRLAERVLDGIAMPSFRTDGAPSGELSFENIEGCCAIHL